MDINLSKLHRTVELYIVDSECFTYTFLRPNFLFQNIFAFNPNLFKDFSFSFPFNPESKISFVNLFDVADVIVSALVNENSDHSDQSSFLPLFLIFIIFYYYYHILSFFVYFFIIYLLLFIYFKLLCSIN